MYNNLLVNYNLTFTYVNSSEPKEVEDAIQSNTKLIWIETPTNPMLNIIDISAISKISKSRNLAIISFRRVEPSSINARAPCCDASDERRLQRS